jgi:hypothetical protein
MAATQDSRIDCSPTDAGGLLGNERRISASDRLNYLAVWLQR